MNMPQAKGESDTDSQKQRKRRIEDQRNTLRPNRRNLSIEDAPSAIRVIVGRTLSELPGWLGNVIANAIQHLKEESHAKGHHIECSNPSTSD